MKVSSNNFSSYSWVTYETWVSQQTEKMYLYKIFVFRFFTNNDKKSKLRAKIKKNSYIIYCKQRDIYFNFSREVLFALKFQLWSPLNILMFLNRSLSFHSMNADNKVIYYIMTPRTFVKFNKSHYQKLLYPKTGKLIKFTFALICL